MDEKSSAAENSAPLKVVVSIAPQKYFIEKIGGGNVRVEVLVRPGSDPHSYEPRASQMAAAAESRLYFTAGLGLEAAWASRIHGVSPQLRLVRLAHASAACSVCDIHEHGQTELPEWKGQAGPDPKQSLAQNAKPDAESDAEPGFEQPERASGRLHQEAGHTWLSPAHVRQMVPLIVEALSKEQPDNAAGFAKNGAAFIREIDDLDLQIRKIFKDIPENRRNFITFHPAWKIFADEYGLQEISLEHDGKEPGPRRLAKLASFAADNGIKVIFAEPQHAARSANAVAESIGARVLVIDPLAENWAENLLDCAALFADSMRKRP